jgi:prepilin-type N-terminal cleavage/methylation domain-containing protein
MHRQKKQSGFTLIEVLVSLFVIMVLIIGVYSLIILATRAASLNKMYVIAIELANQKMERIRNLSYDEVGVVSGIPSGSIPQIETVNRGGTYTVESFVTYYDDPVDGQAGSTTPDTIPTDYKIATVRVSWDSYVGNKDVTVFSKIIPRTVETDQGYGLLKLTVRDSYAQPVPNASVRVVNNVTSPTIDVVNITNAQGELYLPATSSSESFEISVTKTDLLPATHYGQDQTYGTSTGKNPRHLTVTQGNMTEEEFQIDRLATLRLRTVSSDLPDNWQANTYKSGRDEHTPRSGSDGASSLYAVWQADNATSSFVYANRFDSAGARQWVADKRIGTSLSETSPDIAVIPGGGAFVVWQDRSIDLKKITLGESENKLVQLANSEEIRLPDEGLIWLATKLAHIRDGLYSVVARIAEKLRSVGDRVLGSIRAVPLALDHWSQRLADGLTDTLVTNEAMAAGTIVQSLKVSGVVTSSASASLSFTNPPTAGNMLIAIAIHENSNTSFTGVSNTAGAFTQSAISNVSFGLDVGIWHKVAGAAEPSSVTVTASDDLEGGVLMLMEVSGLDTADPVDITRTNDQTGSASKVGTTGMSAVSTENGFAIAAIAFADNDFNNPTSANWTSASTGVWTQRTWTEINGNDDTSLGVATMDVNVAAAQQATLTVTGGFSNEERNSVLVVYNLYDPDDVRAEAIGTQTISVLAGAASTYLGGTFRLTDLTGLRNITSIRVSENGSIDAAADLDNIKIYYDVDTSAPYDCASESYGGSEAQFGATDTDGMSGADGYSVMNGTVSISATQTMCAYVVVDIGAGASKDETIELEISDPSAQVAVSTGTVIPATAVAMSGSTEIDIPAEIRQELYRWRNDDGDEDGASWRADTGVAVTVENSGQLRLRLRTVNVGSISENISPRLEYGEKVTSCSAIAPGSWHQVPDHNSLDWRTVASSQYADDEVTTAQLGSGAFVAGTMEESSSQGPSLALGGDTASESEYVIAPTANAGDLAYCFRLTSGGTAYDAYDTYAEANVVGDENIYIIRLDADGNAVWTAKRVSSDDSSSNQEAPRVASLGSGATATSVVVWQDDRAGNLDIYAQAFDGSGNPLWNGGNDLQITSSSSDEYDPAISFDPGGSIVFAWTESGSLDSVFMARYDQSGSAVWAAPIQGPTSFFSTSDPSLAIDASSSLYLAYTENASGNLASYLARYDSGGNLLWDKGLNKDSDTGDRFAPVVTVSGTTTYAAWTDYRDNNRDIYAQRFDVSGDPVWSRDLLLGVTTSSTTQDSACLVPLSGDRAFGFWTDERADPVAVYAAELEKPGVIAIVGNVSLHLRGTNTVSETPKIYEYELYPVTNGSGQADVLVEPDASGYTLESTSSLSIILLDPPAPLPLTPAEDMTWNIYVE